MTTNENGFSHVKPMKTFVVPESELEFVGSERVLRTLGVDVHQLLTSPCCVFVVLVAGGGQNTWMGNRKTVANIKTLQQSLHGFPGQ